MNSESQSRRECLTAVVRWCTAGLLATGSTVLMLRKVTHDGSSVCLRTTPCQRCGLLSACELPAADALKRRQEEV